MKKLISLALAAITLTSALASCAPAHHRLDSAIALASSDAQEKASWLDERLETFPTDVIVGIGSNEAYGIDMTDFESDGYIVRTIGNDTLIFGATDNGLDRAVRVYAKAAEAGTAEDLDETYHEGYRIERLTIAGNDISEYTVYYSNDNNANMVFAADTFKKYLKKACGVDIDVKEGAPQGKYVEFRFLKDNSIKGGGFEYRVENGNLIIEGAEDYGCANAVTRFFEKECGWDGLAYGDSILAESEHIDVPEGASLGDNPRFEYFYPYTAFLWNYETISPNLEQASFNNYYGGLYIGKIGNACHGIVNNNFLPTSYSAPYQPCYSAEYVYEEMYDSVLAYIEAKIDAGNRIGFELKAIDVAQPDFPFFCTCKDCAKVQKNENGSPSGPVVRFTNRLVQDMRDAGYDGIKYLIFAYQGTKKPCKTSPDKDIYVTFCTDGSCSNHVLNSNECDYAPFYDNISNQTLSSYLEGWLALTPNVGVWYYGLDNGLGSDNHVDTLYGDLTYFDSIGVIGVNLEIEYMGYSLNRILAQLAIIISRDSDLTKEEYMAHYDRLLEKDYGDGWEYIRKIADHWAEGEERNGCWTCWSFVYQITEQYPPYAAEHYDEVYEYARKAILMANSSEQELRCVRMLALVVYQASNCSYFTAYDLNDTQTLNMLETRWSVMYETLVKYGIDPNTVSGCNYYGLAATCEEEAWTEWQSKRENLSYAGVTPRPAPENY